MLNRSSEIRLYFVGALMPLPRSSVLAACILAFASAEAPAQRPPAMKWTHFTIADPLPGSSWGTGGIPLADFDGDVDIVTKVWHKGRCCLPRRVRPALQYSYGFGKVRAR